MIPDPNAPPPTDDPATVPNPFDDLPVSIEGQGAVFQSFNGAFITLTASALPGWRFDRWTGTIRSTLNPVTLMATESTQIGVRFVPENPGEIDSDGDGTPDADDLCPMDATKTDPGTCGCGVPDSDVDEDGILNCVDNCPTIANTNQQDTDADAAGDACDADDDNDQIPDEIDLCPGTTAGATVDADGCADDQVDVDEDGVFNAEDVCPLTANGAAVDAVGCSDSQVDADSDGICDPVAQSTGPSGCTGSDNCPSNANPNQEDSDGDGIGDVCDNDPVCGNGVIETGEMCDPPTCNACNATCQTIDTSGSPVWSEAFDTSSTGALSGVWGTSPDDVFVVGGTDTQGEVYHFSGTQWEVHSDIPNVPLLVWVHGFAPDDVYAVGLGGGMIHYNGTSWSAIETGTTLNLWGVWGLSSEELWIVGGSPFEGDPILLRYRAGTNEFTSVPIPANDRNAHTLFKVWGIGSKVVAVGQDGLIIEYDGTNWTQAQSGASQDLISLWGTSEDNIVAVGGFTLGQITYFDGNTWTTVQPSGVGGLNAVFMAGPNQALIGGSNGAVLTFDPTTEGVVLESSGTTQTIHSIWSDCDGRFYAVGGLFNFPFTGIAKVRTLE